jgi:hypothetical protein
MKGSHLIGADGMEAERRVDRSVVVLLLLGAQFVEFNTVLTENLSGPEVFAPFLADIRDGLTQHQGQPMPVYCVSHPSPTEITLPETGVVDLFGQLHYFSDESVNADVRVVIALKDPIKAVLESPPICVHAFVNNVHVVVGARAPLPVKELHGHIGVYCGIVEPRLSDCRLS